MVRNVPTTSSWNGHEQYGVTKDQAEAVRRLFYQNNDQWLPVETTDNYGTVKNKYNDVGFVPVETNSLRLEIELQEGYSAGVLEWRVGQ